MRNGDGSPDAIAGGPGEGASPPALQPAAEACRNCGARTTGHYCANCGQETRLALPTFGTFMREAAGRYVALDGRMWRTLFALVARPGFLTLEYLQGRRRRYIRPARLFLVLYLLLFALIGFVQSPADLNDEIVFVNSGEAGDPATKAGPPAGLTISSKDAAKAGTGDAPVASAPGAPAASGTGANAMTPEERTRIRNESLAEARREVRKAFGAKDPDPAAASPEQRKGVFDDEDDTLIGLDRDLNLTLRLNGADLPIPAAVRKRYDHFKQLPKEEKAERLYAGALRYGPYAMVVLLPAFALLLQLAYLGRGQRYPGRPRRYAEHLVYAAHLHAFAAIAIIAMLLAPWQPLRVGIALWIVFYVMRARQRVYRGRWWAGLLRSLAIAIVYLVLVSLAILGLLAVAVMLR